MTRRLNLRKCTLRKLCEINAKHKLNRNIKMKQPKKQHNFGYMRIIYIYSFYHQPLQFPESHHKTRFQYEKNNHLLRFSSLPSCERHETITALDRLKDVKKI